MGLFIYCVKSLRYASGNERITKGKSSSGMRLVYFYISKRWRPTPTSHNLVAMILICNGMLHNKATQHHDCGK